MTTSKIEKLIIILLLLFMFPVASMAKGSQVQGPGIQVSGGIVPVYHFSIKPEGMSYKEYFFSGSSIQGLFNYRTGRITVRLGLTWNLLFRVASEEFVVINILSPALSIDFTFKKYFFGGVGLSGLFIPGKTKLDTNSYETKFDLWYSLLGGFRIPLPDNLSLIVELNYSLNVTHRQWSSGTDNTHTSFLAETKFSHMFTVSSGVTFAFNW